MKHACYTWVLILWSTAAFAQAPEKFETLLQSKDISADQRLEALDSLFTFYHSDTARRLRYLKEYDAVAEKLNDPKSLAKKERLHARFYQERGISDEAKPHLDRYLAHAETANDTPLMMTAYGEIGFWYMEQRRDKEAVESMLKELDLAIRSRDAEGMYFAYFDLGALYRTIQDSAKSLKYYRQALSMVKPDNHRRLAPLLNNIGMVYLHAGNHDQALPYYKRAVDEFIASGYTLQLPRPLGNIASVFLYKNQPDSALRYLRWSLRLHMQSDPQSINTANMLASVGNAYMQKNMSDSGLHYLMKGKAIMDKHGSLHQQAMGNVFLSDAYAQIGDFKNAYEYFKTGTTLHDSLVRMEKEQAVQDIAEKYQSEQKEKEIAKQQQLLAQQRTVNYMTAALAVFFLLGGIVVYNSLRKQRKQSKELAIAKERAEQSEKFKQQFLANMSHEIRTPMNAVLGMTNFLVEQNPRPDQQYYLNAVRKSSETLLHIINDILDLSKIEAGKIELEQIAFAPNALVEQVKEMMSIKADEKGLQLLTHVDSNVPDVLIGDPVRLNQILMNLAGNAIKFTEKGSVAIEVKRVGGSDEKAAVEFKVVDTGIGIPKDKLDKVFESFSQANTSDTRRFGGTGLGLSISKQLIELQNGKLKVESEEGAGSVFSFVLELNVGTEHDLMEAQATDNVDATALNGLRILLVDDNEYNRVVAVDTLKSKANVTIDTAENGKRALELISQIEYDVVLMDVQMPEMDGFEATRRLRSGFSEPKRSVPVIALTASVLRTDLDKCRQAGMNSYVPKPFKPSQLVSAILDLIGKNASAQPRRLTERSVNKQAVQSTGNVVDLTYLKSFCDNDAAQMNKYIAMFCDDAPDAIRKINAAMESENTKALHKLVHAFKPRLQMMGMKQALEFANNIEHKCNVGENVATVRDNVNGLVESVEKATRELSKVSVVA